MSSSQSSDEESPSKRARVTYSSSTPRSSQQSKPKTPCIPDIPGLNCNPFSNPIDHKITVFFFQKYKNFDKLTVQKTFTDELQKFLVERKFFESRSAKSRRSRGVQHFMVANNVHRKFSLQGAFIQCTIRVKQKPDIKWLLVQREFNKNTTLLAHHTCSVWLQEVPFKFCTEHDEILQRVLQVMDFEFEKYRTEKDEFKPKYTKVNDYKITMARVGIIAWARSLPS